MYGSTGIAAYEAASAVTSILEEASTLSYKNSESAIGRGGRSGLTIAALSLRGREVGSGFGGRKRSGGCAVAGFAQRGEDLGTVRPQEHDGGGGDESRRGTCERERCALREPDDRRPLERQPGRECADIRGAVEQRAIGQWIGTAEPRAVEGDQSHVESLERALGESAPAAGPRARREQHRHAVRGPPFRPCDPAVVRDMDRVASRGGSHLERCHHRRIYSSSPPDCSVVGCFFRSIAGCFAAASAVWSCARSLCCTAVQLARSVATS